MCGRPAQEPPVEPRPWPGKWHPGRRERPAAHLHLGPSSQHSTSSITAPRPAYSVLTLSRLLCTVGCMGYLFPDGLLVCVRGPRPRARPPGCPCRRAVWGRFLWLLLL